MAAPLDPPRPDARPSPFDALRAHARAVLASLPECPNARHAAPPSARVVHVKSGQAYDRSSEVGGFPHVFLGGHDGGPGDWRTGVLNFLGDADVVVMDPRGDGYDPEDAPGTYEDADYWTGPYVSESGPEAFSPRAGWDAKCLKMADAVAFWLPGGPRDYAPLVQLGMCMAAGKTVIVGSPDGDASTEDVEAFLMAATGGPVLFCSSEQNLVWTVVDFVSRSARGKRGKPRDSRRA